MRKQQRPRKGFRGVTNRRAIDMAKSSTTSVNSQHPVTSSSLEEDSWEDEQGEASTTLTSPVPSADGLEWDEAELRDGPIDSEVVEARTISRLELRRPKPMEFFRIHPTLRTVVRLIRPQGSRTPYLIWPTMRKALERESYRATLYFVANRDREFFTWALSDSTTLEYENTWVESAREAVLFAGESWVRLRANRKTNRYDCFKCTRTLPEPVWPSELTITDVLRLTFKSFVITSWDHPTLKDIRDEEELRTPQG